MYHRANHDAKRLLVLASKISPEACDLVRAAYLAGLRDAAYEVNRMAQDISRELEGG